MKTTDTRDQYVKIIFDISNIPDVLDANDPNLKNSLQSKFDIWLNSSKLSFALNAAKRAKVTQNIAEGKSTREGLDEEGMTKLMEKAKNRNFTPAEIVSLVADIVDEKLNLLASVPLEEFNKLDQRRIKWLRSFLETKKTVKLPKTVKVEKSFTQFLINVPDDKKERFASLLRDEFKTEKGKRIRYMIEALSRLCLLTYTKGEMSELYRAMKKYFNQNIGSYNSVFNPKPEESVTKVGKTSWEEDIESTIDRINPLYLNVKP